MANFHGSSQAVRVCFQGFAGPGGHQEERRHLEQLQQQRRQHKQQFRKQRKREQHRKEAVRRIFRRHHEQY